MVKLITMVIHWWIDIVAPHVKMMKQYETCIVSPKSLSRLSKICCATNLHWFQFGMRLQPHRCWVCGFGTSSGSFVNCDTVSNQNWVKLWSTIKETFPYKLSYEAKAQSDDTFFFRQSVPFPKTRWTIFFAMFLTIAGCSPKNCSDTMIFEWLDFKR